MEFDFDIGRALGAPPPPKGSDGTRVHRVEVSALDNQRWGKGLRELLDKAGERSKRAQGLGKAVTCGHASSFSGESRVYIIARACTFLGLLKVGPKRLFVAQGEKTGLVEISPLCVLDFYVVEGNQRGGLGRRLFQAMLAREGTSPDRLAYDRPSPKLLGFMRKHYGLARYNPQANNFVVYDAYFTGHGTRRPSREESINKGVTKRSPSAPAAPASAARSSSRSADIESQPYSECFDSADVDEDVQSLLNAKALSLDPPKGLTPTSQMSKRLNKPPLACTSGQKRDAGYCVGSSRPLPRSQLGSSASRSTRGTRSASPLCQAGRAAVAPNPLVQAMAQGLLV